MAESGYRTWGYHWGRRDHVDLQQFVCKLWMHGAVFSYCKKKKWPPRASALNFLIQHWPTGGSLHMSEVLLPHFKRTGLETVPSTRTCSTLDTEQRLRIFMNPLSHLENEKATKETSNPGWDHMTPTFTAFTCHKSCSSMEAKKLSTACTITSLPERRAVH